MDYKVLPHQIVVLIAEIVLGSEVTVVLVLAVALVESGVAAAKMSAGFAFPPPVVSATVVSATVVAAMTFLVTTTTTTTTTRGFVVPPESEPGVPYLPFVLLPLDPLAEALAVVVAVSELPPLGVFALLRHIVFVAFVFHAQSDHF